MPDTIKRRQLPQFDGGFRTRSQPVVLPWPVRCSRGILRMQRRPVKPAAALTSTEVRLLLGACGDDPGGRNGLPGLRDRALLLIGFAGCLRRGELVALDCQDVRFTAEGLILRIRYAKGDQEGRAPMSASPAAPAQRPARCARWRPGCAAPASPTARSFPGSRPAGRLSICLSHSALQLVPLA